MATAVTLSRYAEIRAEMEAGVLRDAALARAGLTPEDWTAAQREWLAKMGAEIERGRFELTNQYTQTFLDRQRQLTAKPKLLDASPTPAVYPPTPPASVAAARVELPSFALAAASPEPVASRLVTPGVPIKRAPSPLAGTSMAIGPRGPVVPFAPAPPPPPPPAAASSRPVPNRAPAALTGTTKDLVIPKGPAVPFAPTPGAPTPKRPPAELAGTSIAFEMPKLPAMPFAPKGPPSEAPAMPAPKRPPAALTGTSMALDLPKAPVVPFSKAPPAPPPPVAAPLLVGGLTLEQHVSLCAEMAFDPARAAETLARYRTTAEAKADLDRQWNERFAADRQLEARWHEAFRVYTEFLRKPR